MQHRILNVDDNPGARYAKSRVLALAGFEVIEAESGYEALEMARTEQPELVLLDVKLPDVSGYEVCRQLKAGALTRDVIVLQTSAALTETRHKVEALDAGADSFLVEPIDPQELIANVKALLRLRKAEQSHRVAQALLEDREERFRLMAETINDVFWVAGPGGQLSYISPACRSLFGQEAEQLMSHGEAWKPALHEADRERAHAAYLTGVARGEYADEFRVTRPDGSVRWVEAKAFAVTGSSGERRIVGVSRDVTEYKKSLLALEAADVRKDEFLAMLAHELRNPLAPIRHAIEIMRLSNCDEHALAAAREVIGRQVTHLTRLVDDLLDVSRINQGKITLRIQALDLSDVLRDALETARPLVEAKQHRLQLDGPADTVMVQGDPVRLTQLLGNLLANACKFTPAGGSIILSVKADGEQVCLAVQDDGVGISPEVLPSVFDLFSQADKSLDRSQGGLGIGLALVRRIVELHGGTVNASSAGLGKGSRFEVRIPRLQAGTATDSATEQCAKPAPAAMKVLVVDDMRDSAEALGALLAAVGHDTRIAGDGYEALDIARQWSPDLVLLDIGLPGLSGYDVARRLRDAGARMKLVALTGYGRPEDAQQARDAGFDRHLVKPVAFNTLMEVMTVSAAARTASPH